jgi:ubiquinol-cytochrome c reductase cytochrome c subunit
MRPDPRRRRGLLGWALMLGAVAAGLLLRGPAQAQPLPEQLSEQERLIAQRIYANDCAICHGASGLGGAVPGTDRRAPRIGGDDPVSVAVADLVLRTGRMPPAGDPFDNRARRVAYDEATIAVLVAWMAEEFDLPGDVIVPPPGDPSRGLAIWAGNCAQCHGATGAGGVAGAGAWTPSVNDKDPITIAEAIRVGPFEMPAFSREQISDQELGDVVAFMEEVRSERGTPVFGLVELNPVYASAFAGLLTVVVVIAVVIIAGRPSWFPDPEQSQPTEDRS